MTLVDENIVKYAGLHTTAESDLLKRINRETHLKVLKPRMLAGHLQGRLLSMISQMIQPELILEIGTYTGYSAICLAEGLAPGGRLVTIDRNDELEERVRGYFHTAGLQHIIDYRIGNALDILPTLEGPFDLVFIDADKEKNGTYYDEVIGKVRAGGYIVVDNVLWSGKVLDDKPDKHTTSVLDFNDKVQQDERVENVLLPIRDGITIMRKIAL